MTLQTRHPVLTDPLRGKLESKLRALGRPEAELHAIREHSQAQGRAEWARALHAGELPARASRIAGCGTLRAAVVQSTSTGTINATGFAADRCRDRLCPRCAAMRAHELGHDLRLLIAHEAEARKADGTRLYFVTLTQPKDASETPAQALTRLHRAWARTVHKRWVAGERLRETVIGGVRAIELTYSDGVTPNKHGYVPRKGWHAHVHAIVEARGTPRQWWPEMRKRWIEVTGGDDAAQHCQPLTERRTGQLCKYPLKPFELKDRKVIRSVALALDGARMIDGYGSWRGWMRRSEALRRAPAAKLRACGTALAVVLLHHAGKTESTTPCAVSWRVRDVDGHVRERFVVVDPRAVIAGGYLRSGTPLEMAAAEAERREEKKRARLELQLQRQQAPPVAA